MILRFRELRILKAELCVAEVPTAKTIAARLAVVTEGAVSTVLAFEKMRRGRALLAVHAFDTTFAVLYG